MEVESAQEKMSAIVIVGASGLPTRKPTISRNAFVKIRVDRFSGKTRPAKKTTSPLWSERFLIPDLQPSSMLSLRVYDDSGLFKKNDFLGGIERPVSEFLNEHHNDITVELEALEDKRNIPNRGSLTLRFEEDIDVEACEAIPQAVEAGSESPAPKTVNDLDSLTLASTIATKMMSRPLQTLTDSLDPIVKILGELAKIHPLAGVACVVVSSLYKIPKAQADQDQSIVDLCKTMANTYSSAKRARALENIHEVKEIVDKILNQTVECAFFIQEYFECEFGGRLLRDMISAKSMKVTQFNKVFFDLQRALEGEIALQIAFVSFRSSDKIENMTRDHKLSKLKAVRMPTGSRARCLPKTRSHLIDSITQWATAPSPEYHHNVLWLWGFSGSGKSTLATTVADLFYHLNRLGAFLFFDRKSAERSDPDGMIRTLAFQLSSFDDQIAENVASAIDNNKGIIDRSFSDQFRILIAEPLALIDPLRIAGPILVVLDALDECGDEKGREDLLSVLARESAKLPLSIRFLVTSRPELDIKIAFDGRPNILPLELDITSESNTYDITLFIRDCLRKIIPDDPDWPGEDRMSQLVNQAAGLFIWASTACEFIKGTERIVDHEDLLNLVLSSAVQVDGEKSLDMLYSAVMKFNWKNETLVKAYQSIIGTIVAAKSPLSAKAITNLHKMDDPFLSWSAIRFVRPLTSLLNGTEVDTAPLRPLHKSFDDFVTDKDRSGDHLFIDKNVHGGRLARLCMMRMNNSLKRNSSKLGPCKLISELDLKVHLVQYASEDLQYACLFWSEHLETADALLYDSVSTFFFKHLLHWIELLSMMDVLNSALPALARVDYWLKHIGKGDGTLLQLIHDAGRFIREFFDPISRSPGMVYRSALPFSPADTILFKTYKDDQDIVVSGNSPNWTPCLRILKGHAGVVRSAVFSPNGKQIVSGSWDSTVQLWDTETGGTIGGPLRGHTDSVVSVAFSPNGKLIVSGSLDGTVLLWDSRTGTVIGEPLRGHTDWVWSVAFSPDGNHIVSGSWDRTVRLWDLGTGQMIGGPLKGHTDHVWSVCFSPDGKQIVSGSQDETVQLWNSETGESIGEPLRGHTGVVTSVAFSPDGKQVASGSGDCTVKLWDPATGHTIGESLRGHFSPIHSVAYSPDGNWIVSGSKDHTLRLWNAATGGAIGEPLRGHTDWLFSAVFSPDGKWIVSGSEDCTVRLWDWMAGVISTTPYNSHTDWFRSVAFSTDGKWVASGSWDSTVRLWDTLSGRPICKPAEGHTGQVESVAFSPDGKQIVSGSKDCTVRQWDAMTGGAIGEPLRCHSQIFSVVFSSDGKLIASGSMDGTIQLWDTETGKAIGQPLIGHAHCWSVNFSPDGKWIVSGSKNGTVQLWDLAAHGEIYKSLKGHNDQIRMVAFSADGKQIISGSDDSTVRLWSMATMEAMGQPLKGPTDDIRAFTLLGNGKQIILGSKDFTVSRWDLASGLAIATEDEVDNLEPLVIRSTGWVIGPKGNLLWWLPPDHRGKSLWTHGQLTIANSSGSFSIINPDKLLHAIYPNNH